MCPQSVFDLTDNELIVIMPVTCTHDQEAAPDLLLGLVHWCKLALHLHFSQSPETSWPLSPLCADQITTFFSSLGFEVPERKGTCDFLQEVTSQKDQGVRA